MDTTFVRLNSISTEVLLNISLVIRRKSRIRQIRIHIVTMARKGASDFPYPPAKRTAQRHANRPNQLARWQDQLLSFACLQPTCFSASPLTGSLPSEEQKKTTGISFRCFPTIINPFIVRFCKKQQGVFSFPSFCLMFGCFYDRQVADIPLLNLKASDKTICFV